MTSVMVTGASGFIGRQCLTLLQSKGYDIHAVSRRPLQSNALQNVHWHELDLLSPGVPAQIIERVNPAFLLHLAWYARPGEFWTAPENVDWVRASIELATSFARAKGNRMVVAGSCTEYDWTSGECVEGSAVLKPSTLYGASKGALSSILHSWSETTGLDYAWARIFHLYGPFEHPSRLVSYCIRSLLDQQPALCSDGAQIHDFSHVRDVAGALVALLETSAQGPVNIGSGVPVTVREVLTEIGRQIDRPDLIRFGARNSNGTTARIWANVSRLSTEVHWSPHYNLRSGIEQTIEWWRKEMDNPGAFLSQ